jgi:hypothetical protein
VCEFGDLKAYGSPPQDRCLPDCSLDASSVIRWAHVGPGTCRLYGNGSVPSVRWDCHRCVCAQTLRIASAFSENQGCAFKLPSFCEVGVRVGANCRIPRNLGRLDRQLSRNLGGLPSRTHRWFYGDDGLCSRAASAPSFLAMLTLTVGCLLRVSSEILAYQGFAHWAWSWLPVSALIGMTAVTLFAVNLFATFMQPARSGG